MPRVDARTLAAYVGGLEQSSAQLRELSSSLPRVFARDEHVTLVRGSTDTMLDHARAGIEQLRDTPYEAIAWSAYEDVTRSVAELGNRTRGSVRRLADDLDRQFVNVRAQLAETRRTTFDADVTAGGAQGQAAIDELVGAIDRLTAPGARFDGVDAAIAGDALASTSWRLPARPALGDIHRLEELAADAATDPRRAFDLQRLLAAWRPTIVDEFVPGPELASRARSIVDRGADDLAPDDWRTLVRLADADPAGAYVRRPSEHDLADVAYGAITRGRGTATWEEHVLVEGMSLALARADSELGVLRHEARALLRDGADGFGNREWARLAELARFDPSYRVLPTTDAHSVRDALGDALTEYRRTEHPRALTPSGRYYGDGAARDLAAHWRGHVFGIGANLRMHLLDGGIDAAIRGIGRIETAAGGFTDDVIEPPASRAEAARRVAGFVGKVTGRSVAGGIRRGVDAITAPRITTEQLDAVMVGGAIPERLSIGELRRSPQWREAPRVAKIAALARMVARHEPTSMAESRTMVRQVRKLQIDESQLSPGLRQRWREALAVADREDRSLRAVGEYRKGYEGHADYANLGRLRSTLELVGLELAARSQAEQLTAAAARAASEPVASAPAAATTTAAAHVDDGGWALDEAANPLDEVLSW